MTIKCSKKKAIQTDSVQNESKLVQVGDGEINELDMSCASSENDHTSKYIPSVESENKEKEECQNEHANIPFIQPAPEHTC